MIALYRLDMVWQQKQKEEPKQSPGHTTRRVKQQKHHAETRDPPSQDPRDHMGQADRHNNSPIITSEANNDNAESGGPYYKAKLHAGCSAGVGQLYGPSINRSVVNSSEQRHKDVHLEVINDRSVCWFEVRSNGNGFHGLMYFDIILS